MGGRSSTGNRNVTPTFNTLPEMELASGMRITKRAREVFDREYRSLRELATRLIENGDYNSQGYTTLHSDDNEPVFTIRMLEGMATAITNEFKNIKMDEELGVSTPEKRLVRRYALNMMTHMMNKYYNSMYPNGRKRS